jgi:hypothetical protein
LKCKRIAHARDRILQRDLHHKELRNSVLILTLKVIAKIDQWQKPTYKPGVEGRGEGKP